MVVLMLGAGLCLLLLLLSLAVRLRLGIPLVYVLHWLSTPQRSGLSSVYGRPGRRGHP